MEENKQTEELTEEVSEKESEAAEEKDEATLLREKIAELEKEIKEKDDKYLRMAAEYDNFRRRSREERDATYAAAECDTVAQLLPIIDNLERAALYDDAQKVKEGLVMIAKATSEVFSKLGCEEFGKAGEAFDPNIAIPETIRTRFAHNIWLQPCDYGDSRTVSMCNKAWELAKAEPRFRCGIQLHKLYGVR